MEDKEEKLDSGAFKELSDLNLTETEIDSWESIDALTSWMPALLSLRLGKALPLFKVRTPL